MAESSNTEKLAEGLSTVDYPHRGTKSSPDGPGGSSGSKNDRIMEMMIRNINDSHEYWNRIYDDARIDLNFAYNDQWDPRARNERERAGKPVVSPTLIPQFINRVAGASRQAKISVHVQQTGGPSMYAVASDGSRIPFSEVMEGLIRDIEARSMASLLYSRSVQHAVESGVGWLRVRIVKGPHDPFNSEIVIEHIKDRFSVIIDHLAEDPNLQDANHAFISKFMNMDDFKKKWPRVSSGRDSPSPIVDTSSIGPRHFWTKENSIRVGEYYWKEPVTRQAVLLIHESGDEMVLYRDEAEDYLDELQELGFEIVEETEHETYKIMVALVTAKNILEGPFEWPGATIPIVPVLGRQIDTDGDTNYHSLHRYAKDSQIMFNYMCSAAIERTAKSPNTPWLATADAISGLEDIWNDQHVNTRDLLYYNYKDDQPPPTRVPGAEVPAAEITLVNLFRQNLMENIGMYEASLGQTGNEVSGVAIQQRQLAGDMGSLEFLDNLNYAVSTVGNILCDIIPKVYPTKKMRRIILDDEREVNVILNNRIIDEETGTEHSINNIGMARYSANSIAGPQFASQRAEFLSALTEIAKTNPDILSGALDLLVKFMDFPGGRLLERRLKMMIPRQFLSEEEQQMLPEPQPSPEEQAAMMESEAAMATAESKKAVAELEVQEQQFETEAAQVKLEEAKIRALEGDMQAERDQQKEALDNIANNEMQGQDDMAKLEKTVTAIVKKLLAEQRTADKIKQR